MNIFLCNSCGSQVFFDNTQCLTCGSPLGFDPLKMDMMLADYSYKYCQNQSHGVCNWLLPAEEEENFCISCATNKTIPNLTETGTLEKWRAIESAKHRVFYNLLKLNLKFFYDNEANTQQLQFEFLKSYPDKRVMTGHSNGLITLNIAEADPVERTRVKQSLNESYRTLVGHFRHELGHFYWDTLIAPFEERLNGFRQLFGDERKDYSTALNQYYEQGPATDWSVSYVSAYASAHPWEDWAETWAHYLHIMDTAETACANNLQLINTSFQHFENMYEEPNFNQIIDRLIPLFVFANSLNSGMGLQPLYPFQLTYAVIEKLTFIHRLCLQQKPQKAA